MEKRLVLAVLLMFATVVVVNLLFPPAPRRPRTPAPAPPETVQVAEPRTLARAEPVAAPTAAAPAPAETVEVVSPLYRVRFLSRGASLVSAELLNYRSLAEATKGAPVQVVKPGEELLTARWVVNSDTLDLSGAPFAASARRLELSAGDEAQPLEFTYAHPAGSFGARVSYLFYPDRYTVDVRGALEGLDGGWWLVPLGSGVHNNEANEKENLGSLALVVSGPAGIQSRRLREIAPGSRVALEGPHWWVAVRDKYFLVALLALDEATRLGGALAWGGAERNGARVVSTVAVSRDGRFQYRLYLGPQDYGRLAALGHGLQNVNPYGWGFLRPIIRPLAGAITAVLLWARDTLRVGYGWILILFGFAVRAVLFPLYQSTMRSQMRMAELQPRLQELQSRYRAEPARLQQELMKLYREKGMTPLTPLTSGCLPMLLPFPFLIALFFVFRDTIEFRGAAFLWMPDLSRPDPIYVIPVLMGLSMFFLSWFGQRAVPQTNPQMKMLIYVMPVMMTIFFLALPAGLNLYYLAMNVASLPQQLYLNRERRKLMAQAAPEPPRRAPRR